MKNLQMSLEVLTFEIDQARKKLCKNTETVMRRLNKRQNMSTQLKVLVLNLEKIMSSRRNGHFRHRRKGHSVLLSI